jgi:hypothetical protein
VRHHLCGDEVQVVEVLQVQDLQVGAGRARLAVPAEGVDDLRHGARETAVDQVPRVPPDRGRAGLELGLVAAHADGVGDRVDQRVRVPAGLAAHVADPGEPAGGRLGRLEVGVELRGVPGRQLRRTGPALAADDDRRVRVLGRLGQRRRVAQHVVLTVVGEPLADRGLPQPGDDRELLGEPVEPGPGVGELDPVRRVLGLEPSRAQPELDPAAAHLVDLRDADREDAGVAERRRRHQSAEPDPAGLAGDPGQRDPRVGRPRQAVAVAHRQEVVGAEERAEAAFLGLLRDGELIVVRSALLRLDEDSEVHAAKPRRSADVA